MRTEETIRQQVIEAFQYPKSYVKVQYSDYTQRATITITAKIDATFDNLLRLSEALGTKHIDLEHEEVHWKYSTWTQGSDWFSTFYVRWDEE